MTPLDRIDSVINDAASRMTKAKPSDALRAHVLSRISVEKPSRFAWRYVFAGGAIATIGLVAFLAWPHNSAVSQLAISTPTLINPTVINSIAATNPTTAFSPSSLPASVARTAANDSGQLVLATLSDADQEWLSRSVPALEHPELMTPVKPLSEDVPVKAIDFQPIGRAAPLVVLAIGDDNQ